jgi:hypothetical protein
MTSGPEQAMPARARGVSGSLSVLCPRLVIDVDVDDITGLR